ncbi:type II secretion system protein F [Clostridium homopropionicum DSM 5847]|uniref:Type II secretion system protein F n=1 Tax=Clostridium homopropionicum DSM 5847 TaxID=1121318 RepID=A0A0L6ZEK5_9CLOT|nr:type II secretion system F family protein [Clostridium homopropionicum]KOA21419.1 type II secretion system protein F [Clostridium homopropionicum DSM 5847]SFG10474.1 type II secretion system protein F (GspF) [Clostridium homopropionicum]
MPLFKYSAINSAGKKVQGEYTANSENEVLSMIRENDYYPIKINLIEGSPKVSLGKSLHKVKAKDLALFCRQTATLIDAGTDILTAVNLLRKQAENKTLKKSLNEVYEEIQKGVTLSSALSMHGNTYPRLLINMIESGEETGQLGSVMTKMAEQYERESRINGKIKGAFVYPVALTFISIGVVIFLLTFVMPTFVGMFQGSGVELPAPTRFVMSLSNGMKKYWYLIIGAIILIAFAVSKAIKTEKGSILIDKLKLNIPIIKATSRKVITMRFARGLSITLYSGVTMIKSIEIVSKIVDNKLIESKLKGVRERVIKGDMLNEALQDISEFPPMLIAMIKIGEEAGAIDSILEKTAEYYEQEVEASLQKLTTLIEPVLILLMGLLVGGIVIAMIMPMFDMFQTVA